MRSDPLLDVRNIAKSYNGNLVVASASFALRQGEALCLTGPSGIGKSTLLEMAAGVVRPDKGLIRRSTPPALMFQDDVLIPWLTAEENIAYILPQTMPPELYDKNVAFWLKRFDLEEDMHPAAMSGGMRRRLSLARTFAAGRSLILLDEPFAFLDEARQRVVAEEIAAHAASGCGILLTSHVEKPLRQACLAHTPIRFIRVEESPVRIASA